MEELVDLLNENGTKIGVIDKKEAHKKGLWHRVVHVWIMNSKNELLIQKRSCQKSFFPNVWDVSVGGHVDAGESSIDASVREVFEEIGVKLKPNEMEFLFSFADSNIYDGVLVNEIADVFLVRKDVEISKLKYQSEEVETTKWIGFDEFLKKCYTNEFLPHTKGYEKFEEWLKANGLVSNWKCYKK